MQTLKYGMIGDEVKNLQKDLNDSSATRLPRLPIATLFDELTMARVMEFQYQCGITCDGIVGPVTRRRLSVRNGRGTAPLGRVAVVDLINDRLRAFEHGAQKFDFRPIKGGSATDPSKRGVFKVTRRLRHHTSSQFPEPPGNMDFSLFYHRGQAIHQGPPTVPSHGCIHVKPTEAAQLFTWAGQVDLMVIILKQGP